MMEVATCDGLDSLRRHRQPQLQPRQAIMQSLFNSAWEPQVRLLTHKTM